MGSEDVIERVRQALADYTPRQIEEPTATAAAVLVLVYDLNGELHLLFTEPTDQGEHHKGQISFPGGACADEDDCMETTALRETFEEIGVRPEDVRLIGQLDDM